MKKIVEHGIYEKLKHLAGGRVSALRAEQNSETPFIVFQRTDSDDRSRAINNPSGIAKAYIQIDVYDTGYFSTKALAAYVESTLDGFAGSVYYGDDSPQEFVQIAGISLQNDVDVLDQTDEPVLYRSSASYLVTYYQ